TNRDNADRRLVPLRISSAWSVMIRSGVRELLIVLIAALLLSACNPREFPPFKKYSEWSEKEITRQTEEAIKNDPELAELDSVCKQVPVPESFEFIRKGGLDDERVTLSTYYFSHMRYEDARLVWDDYFQRTGWK